MVVSKGEMVFERGKNVGGTQHTLVKLVCWK